ncbi:phosphate-import protein PhnD [Mycolicibacterium chitae]|uniref:Phosphonate ABC transporter periplasmic phosphonate-binding protein n=1 Tax=Mycolicibacterium chitae TaxID=1792 RepID=A0A3S4VI03_MYCCI|nr:phosphate/phosphite/phosphonate ABC transporter substrate-binding protein [Mycolicibacterium chitae]MCV7105393.1 phosphate/phosphite/phosphonate ABC transporter substrate-binding protein [Mycolicibacterium chitae]BBZ04424.1 phosphate-import protein PhnD [Mycolicibacterium chitae]VEG48059.1 phosphonate ABC transporter periplasmic phosphonate-binding protein [Mycolicibacterium chitae]
MSKLFLSRLGAPAALLATAALVLAGCGESADTARNGQDGTEAAADGDTLVLAAVPSEESTALRSQFDGLIALIEAETGKTVEFQQATDYAAVIEGQRANKIDLAMYGPFSYVIGRDGGIPLEPLGALVDEEGEEPGYYSIGWVRADSDITDIAGFADKTVCFVDVASTSGYLYPSAGLLEAGIDPKTGVTPVMAGGHDASMLSVASGQCDAGFAYEESLRMLVDSGQLQPEDVKEVWRSEMIAGSPIAMNTETVDAETQETLKRIFVDSANIPALVEAGHCADAESCGLPEDTQWGFAPVTDATYDGVRQVCEVTKADACNT